MNSDGDTWWGATTFAGAVASVSKAGAILGSSVTITGGAISGASLASVPNDTVTDISLMECSHDLVFSVTDADTIAWATGTIVMSNGRTFAIDAGNTGNMATLTYIYLDPAVSSTVLQTTTIYSTAMGANKRLIGTAQNNTVTANFIPYGAGQILVDGANIGALSIVAGNIAATTITAAKMSVSQLSAIAADLGAITAGTITVDTAGYVRGGQTAYNTGTGFFLGYESAAYKLSIGNPSGEYLTWDGTNLEVTASGIVKSMTAGETINGATLPVPVYVLPADGEVYAVDANSSGELKFFGFAISNSTDGNSIKVKIAGVVSGFTSLTKGSIYYVSDTSGTISTTVGTVGIPVGLAVSATEILIQNLPIRKIIAGSTLLAFADTENISNVQDYTKIKEILLTESGTYTVTFAQQASTGGTTSGRVYKNGVAFGTEKTTTSGTYVTQTEDLVFTEGDLVQLYIKNTVGGQAEHKNFRLNGTRTSSLVILDL